MHPDGNGNLLGGIRACQRKIPKVRHHRLARRQHLVRDLHQVERQPEVSAQLVGQHIERRLQHAANGGRRAAFGAHPLHLRSECLEVRQCRHRALHQREVVAVRHGLPLRAGVARNARQPGLVQKTRGVGNQFVVLLALHERALLIGLPILERDVRADVDARHTVISKARGLRESGPHVDHVGHRGVPREILATADHGLESFPVVVCDFLAGEAGILRGDLGRQRPNRYAVGLPVPHGRDVAVQPPIVEFIEMV